MLINALLHRQQLERRGPFLLPSIVGRPLNRGSQYHGTCRCRTGLRTGSAPTACLTALDRTANQPRLPQTTASGRNCLLCASAWPHPTALMPSSSLTTSWIASANTADSRIGACQPTATFSADLLQSSSGLHGFMRACSTRPRVLSGGSMVHHCVSDTA